MKLIWGLDSKLLKMESFISDHDIWFGERRNQPNVTYDILKLFEGNLDELIICDDLGGVIPDDFLSILMDRLDWYMDMFDRTEYGRMSSYPNRRDYLVLISHLLYSILNKADLEFAFFISPPHFGIDAILADICNFLKIKVYYGYQSLFENRFFVLDYNFSLVKPLKFDELSLKIPDVRNESLFYMQGLKKKRTLKITLLSVIIRRLFGNLNALEFAYCYKRKNRQIVFLEQQKKMNYLLGSADQVENQLKEINYVYFPLHLQPEMTTSQLGGGKYRDQLTAIQEILKILPEGWMLIVKENPKQDWQYRTDAFFSCLRMDPRILIATIGTSSKLLIQYSKTVATISGTVGWEAIRLNKSVICLGKCWFSSLSGVHKLDLSLDLEQLSQRQIESVDLQTSFNQLLSMSWQGVIDVSYQCLCAQFDSDINTNLIGSLLRDLPRASTVQHISF